MNPTYIIRNYSSQELQSSLWMPYGQTYIGKPDNTAKNKAERKRKKLNRR